MSTKIEWCDETWNPVTGCSYVSTGCDHCYARRMAQRLRGRCGYPKDKPFSIVEHGPRDRGVWAKPYHWKKPRRIFVCSMGDLFHKDVPADCIMDIFQTASDLPRHTFIFLTKRTWRMARELGRWRDRHGPIGNAHFGVSVETQFFFDIRVNAIKKCDRRFVSLEPLLGPIDLSRADCDLSWVIVGGEMGPGARPMQEYWAMDIRDQCQEMEIPFFFKQRGPTKKAGRLLDGREYLEVPQ